MKIEKKMVELCEGLSDCLHVVENMICDIAVPGFGETIVHVEIKRGYNNETKQPCHVVQVTTLADTETKSAPEMPIEE